MLFVFLCHTAGIFGLFFILKQNNYETVFSSNADELNLVKLVIPKSENIFWEQKDEIVYNGEYYDIFNKSEDVKNIYLLCYNDCKDNRLAEAFHQQLSKESFGKKPANLIHGINIQSHAAHNFSWNFSIESPEIILIPSLAVTLSGFESVFSPPPDFLVC